MSEPLTTDELLAAWTCPRPCVEDADRRHHFSTELCTWAHDEPDHPAAKAGHDVWFICKHCDAWLPWDDDAEDGFPHNPVPQRVCQMLVGHRCDEHGDAGEEIWCSKPATHWVERTVPACDECAAGIRAEGLPVSPMSEAA